MAVVWIAVACGLYAFASKHAHTQAHRIEFWIAEIVWLAIAVAVAGLLRADLPGRSVQRRLLTVPWLWLSWVFGARRRRARQRRAAFASPVIYARDSPMYRASLENQNLPSFVRRARGLPDYHDESQFR